MSAKPIDSLTLDELARLETELAQDYERVSQRGLALDLTRGKPGADQLALSDALDGILAGDYRTANGTDARNYGGLRGIPEARELGAELLDVPAENVIAGGNASLTLMYQIMDTCLRTGLWGDGRHWGPESQVLCPVPGYDRHFTVCETLGVGMTNVPITPKGPDMDEVEARASADAHVKGIWCVPKYSNPTGCCYDDETVERLAALPERAAADDFVVLWDNAYAVHDLELPAPRVRSLLGAAEERGTQDHVVLFASTSKITFAGAGVAFLASSERVLASLEGYLSAVTIGPDKVNQLRHARFLKGRLAEQMQRHAALIKPRFDIVQRVLDAGLQDLEIAEWTRPRGGYFISLDTRPGLAQQVVQLAADVGLKLTPAGATFPYGKDPEDRNIRIAPTFATLEDLEAAVNTLVLCLKLATVRQRLAGRG